LIVFCAESCSNTIISYISNATGVLCYSFITQNTSDFLAPLLVDESKKTDRASGPTFSCISNSDPGPKFNIEDFSFRAAYFIIVQHFIKIFAI